MVDSDGRFALALPHPLHAGHLVVVSGTPEEDCTRFSVNFTCGEGSDPDLALHFNPRLEQDYVVRNSRINGSWGTEETPSTCPIRFVRKQQFQLAFLLTEKHFIISINELKFCEYRYRLGLNKIKNIEIVGDVVVQEVHTREVKEYPHASMEYVTQVPFGDESNITLPLPNIFIGQLAEVLQAGQQVEIYGRVKLLPHAFYVNLQEGFLTWPHPQIPVHLNPRFNTRVGAYTLIRNAWVTGSWGPEERTPGFGFCPGKEFHIAVRCESDHFTVWVNGKMEGLFKFRTDEHQIDTVYIEGDLFIHKVFVSDRNLLLLNS